MNKPDWKDSPKWADRLMQSVANCYYWCNVEQYVQSSFDICRKFGGPCAFTIGDLELVEMRLDPWAEDKDRKDNIMDKIDWTTAPHDADVFISGYFRKWADGEEYISRDSSDDWLKCEVSWNI
jgi:hypothetical protein